MRTRRRIVKEIAQFRGSRFEGIRFMAKLMFRFVGEAKSGPIQARLLRHELGKDIISIDLPLGEAVEIDDAGQFELEVKVKGYGYLGAQLTIDPKAHPPRLKPKVPLPRCFVLTRLRNKDPRSQQQSPWLIQIRCALDYPRELVFVTGIDEKGRANYGSFAKTRRRDSVSRKRSSISPRADSSTMVTEFDFKTGTRTTRMLRSPSRWTIVDQEELGTVQLSPPSAEGISITHVYDWIIQAGKECPGRIVELAFFSHAYALGPILANSFDRSTSPDNPDRCHPTERDPNDHDPRLKDFSGSVFDIDEFATAFSTKANCYNQGCFTDRECMRLSKIVRKPKPKDPDYLFTLSREEKTYVTWVDAEKRLRGYLNNNFSRALALASGVPCWGSPPGAGASYAHSGGRHWFTVDMKNYGGHVRRLVKIFDVSHNDRWYIKFSEDEFEEAS